VESHAHGYKTYALFLLLAEGAGGYVELCSLRLENASGAFGEKNKRTAIL